MSGDRYDLQRFVDAQDAIYARAVTELRQGRKRTHWMWFIFPQLEGLGHSAMARRYAISSIEEAREFLRHPLLGARLKECAGLVTEVDGRSLEDIFGYPDYLKFHSSMTLFAKAAEDGGVYLKALAKYFASTMDRHTLERLDRPGKPA